MFVYSVRGSKLKFYILAAVALIVIIVALLVSYKGNKPAAQDGAITLKASSAQERLAFLSQFGWKVDDDPVEVMEIIIPSEFDEVYEKYNKIQLEQNMDLSKYCGLRAKLWTYNVKNYPDYPAQSGLVQANIIVYDGMVIGGDVSSIELDGFMQGFDYPAAVTQTEKTDAASVTTGEKILEDDVEVD